MKGPKTRQTYCIKSNNKGDPDTSLFYLITLTLFFLIIKRTAQYSIKQIQNVLSLSTWPLQGQMGNMLQLYFPCYCLLL